MKNLLKTTKKKVVAGATCITLVAAGGGFVFASTGAGGQLSDWYKGQFDHAVEEGTQDVYKYGKGEAAKAIGEYNHLKSENVKHVGIAETAETYLGKRDINAEKDQHIKDTNDMRDEILGSMNAQLKELLNQGKGALNEITNQAKDQAKTDLENSIDGATTDAVARVNADLDAETDQAVKDLETAIANAKNIISKKLDSESKSAIEELKGDIDNSVKEVQEMTKKIAEEHLNKSRLTIQKAAHQKVDNAKKSLKQVVSGINN